MPKSEVDAVGPQLELVHHEYTLPEREIHRNGFHWQIFKQELVKDIPVLSLSIAEEVEQAFDRVWGTDKEWTTVYAWDSILRIVSQVSNRAFSGLDLCAHCSSLRISDAFRWLTMLQGRNEEFLKRSRRFSTTVFAGSAIINMCPRLVKSVVGSIVRCVANRHRAVCKRLALHIVEERLNLAVREKKQNGVKQESAVCTLKMPGGFRFEFWLIFHNVCLE